jgi:hypothetical protein
MKFSTTGSAVVFGLLFLAFGTAVCQTIEIGSQKITFIAVGDDWQYFKGTVAPSEAADAWTAKVFDDSAAAGWLTGPSGFGYGDGDDATVLDDMQGRYRTVYIRKSFSISDAPADAIVQLVIDYDDGFVVYLNGNKMDSRHMPEGTITYETNATSHDAGTPEVIPLGTVGDLLDSDFNVLAVEGHNTSLSSTDFSLIPALYAVSDSQIELTEDTVWSGTYLIKSPVVVADGVTLTIEQGSVLMMQNGVGITVNGRLMAEGTEAEPVTFTRDPAGSTWERLMFVNAEDSRLSHCVIEYANASGDHKDYYDNDCDEQTPPLSRSYHEAVAGIASHLDLESCVFRNLPNDGDALAIISDDPDNPGAATANIIGCQFLSIGQGVHTRYSYVLVENCYFTGHDGDNDDVDLYGESTPPPLIINNRMINPRHDDMINPTRCSAIIIGNIIAGCDDHGVVLRDKCYPVVMNNLIYNCSSAGIAVQNQCDALITNNTIVNCGRGIRFFGHTDRLGPPYCLYPGSGSASIVNCIMRDCPTTLELASNSAQDSYAAVSYCNIEGGRAAASVSTNSILEWDESSNIDQDPFFADQAGGDFHLKSQAGRWDPVALAWVKDAVHSPSIDAGDPTDEDWKEELWPNGRLINMGRYGGTPEASMSIDPVGNAADLNHDNIVSLEDLTMLAAHWRMNRMLLDSDIDRDGIVALADLLRFAEQWLWQP